MATSSIQADYEKMRHSMVVSQLRTNGVNDPRVVAAMATVPREQFLPEGVRKFAYTDRSLPLGGGREQNDPLATGRLLTEAEVGESDKVLLIGAAGGYTAALLSKLAREVVAVEVAPELAALARRALADCPNVTLVEGPLAGGYPAGAPYDLMVIDGAVEHLPDRLIEQVRPGGRVVTGIVERGVSRLAAGHRSEGGFGLQTFVDMDCVVLPGFARPRGFQF